MSALREALKKLDWRRVEQVKGVEEYGAQLFVRNLSEYENGELIQSWMLDANGDPDASKRRLFQARLIQICLTDEDGNAVYEESDGFPDSGLDEIVAMPARLCELIGNHCLTMLGMKKTAENAEGN